VLNEVLLAYLECGGGAASIAAPCAIATNARKSAGRAALRRAQRQALKIRKGYLFDSNRPIHAP
jgi:hypothetical protein